MILFFQKIKKILLVSILFLYPMALLAQLPECNKDNNETTVQGTDTCIEKIPKESFTLGDCPDGESAIQGTTACSTKTEVALSLALPYAECESGWASKQGTSEGTSSIECTQERKTITLESFFAEVQDNKKAGFVIGDMNTSDEGTAELGTRTFTLSGTGADKFSIASDYTITLNEQLDFNDKQEYNLTVIVENSAGISRRVNFTIQVLKVELYITNAFYDDNNTTDDDTDDKLYIQYNVDLNNTEDAIAEEIANVFVVNADKDGIGNDRIDTTNNSRADYNATIKYYHHIISLDNTQEELLEHNITIDINADPKLVGSAGEEAILFNTIIKKAINYEFVKKTGQILSYDNAGDNEIDQSIKDDGYYQVGAIAKYTRANDVVTDLILGLEWVDNVDIQRKYWLTEDNYNDCVNNDNNSSCYDTNSTDDDTATEYCDKLDFASHTDWRLPTRSELESLVDYSKSEKAINSIFQNTDTDTDTDAEYWSSDTYVEEEEDPRSSAWIVNFSTAEITHTIKYDENGNGHYIRCVRTIN